MKILVVSDTHGDYNSFYNLVRMQNNAEVVIFLGDGMEEFDEIKGQFSDKMFISVKGNNDWSTPAPLCDERVIEGKRIFMTHGHAYGVKHGLCGIVQEGHKRNADIVLFGHTHEAYEGYKEGMYILNPGSLHKYTSSYGVIEIKNGQILTNTATFGG